MADTVYVVGYQPIETVTRKLKIVDVLNLVISKGLISNNILTDVANHLSTIVASMDDSDYILLNSAHNMNLLYGLSSPSVFVYDPSISATERELTSIVRNLLIGLGSNNTARLYRDSLNNIRSGITELKDQIPADTYFNLLTLLTDLNKSDVESLNKYILSLTKEAKKPFTKRAIYVGDVIDPEFFKNLEDSGVHVVKYYPYENFLLPVDSMVKSYFNNSYYNRILLHTKTELRTALLEYAPQMLIINPGGIYLTEMEADHLVETFKNDVTVYKLPGIYKGVSLQT